VIYLDEKLPTHPKIFKAGAMLGPDGPAQALALFVAGIGYAREHLTDGYLPDGFVSSCGLVQTPQSVAKALASRSVRLWHRRRGGYQIHDFEDWNRKASQVKEKREKERQRKASWRARGNGHERGESRGVSRGDVLRDSRARGTTNHDPLSGTRVLRTVPDRYVQTAADASVLTFPRKRITHRVLCAMVTAELHEPDYGSLVEAVKLRIAHQGFAYPTGEQIESAIEAVSQAQERRRAGGRR